VHLFIQRPQYILFACSASFLLLLLPSAHRTPTGVSLRRPQVPSRELNSLFARDTASSNNITILDGITYFNGTSYWAVTCVYSVSGVYTRFQRILFYAVLVFTFALRFHEWLTAVGVAFIVTYSSTTAIHAIFLCLQHNVGTDLDQLAVWPVVQPAAIGGITFALYAPHVINIDPTQLYVSWTLLLTFASIVLQANGPRFLRGFGSSAVMVACDMYYNCNDTCQPGMNDVLFRTSYDQMVPIYLGPWASDNTNTTAPADDSRVGLSYMEPQISSYVRSLMIGLLIGLVLRTQVENIGRPPRASRDWVFRLFASKRTAAQCGFSNRKFFLAQTLLVLYYSWQALIFSTLPLTLLDLVGQFLVALFDKHESREFVFECTGLKPHQPVPRSRLLFAKSLALAWYIWASTAYLVWPALFIYHVVDNERTLDGISESERLQAVEQWGSWVSVALAFLGACLNKLLASPLVAQKKEVIYLNMIETEMSDDTSQSGRATLHTIWLRVKTSEIFILLVNEWMELKNWWENAVEVSWASEPPDKISDEKHADGLTKDLEEHPLLAWCRSEEEEIGYDVLLDRISDHREMGLKHPWSNRWPVRDEEVDEAAQPPNAAAVLWPLNDHYENQSEEEDEVKSQAAEEI
jgi:hypothetical protein